MSAGAIDFSILDNILDVGIVINEKGLIHFFNKKAEEFFQWKRTEIIGRNVKMLMPRYTRLPPPPANALNFHSRHFFFFNCVQSVQR